LHSNYNMLNNVIVIKLYIINWVLLLMDWKWELDFIN
jgi:hypothetical protein